MSSPVPSDKTVTQHPLQDVDLTDTSPSQLSDAPKNVKQKENWVKFDDDASEGILGTSDNNNELAAANTAATATTNRLTPSTSPIPSPLPPPTNPKRHSAYTTVAGGAVRVRTPTGESGQQQQQLQTTQLDVTAATPVQVNE